MGNTFTVADAYLFVLTSWGQAPWLKSYYKTSIHFDQLQHLEAWYGRMRERDAVRRSILAEGLAF